MRAIAVLGCCAAGLTAQQVLPTAHPQESLVNTSGNLAPLGVFANGNAAESRTQILLRAFELPGPGAVLTGVEFHCQSDVSLVYQSLVVRVSPTAATALGTTFATNLPAPQTVLLLANQVVSWQSAGWSRLPFTPGYVHDGHSSLVLDIQKIVSPVTFVQTSMDTPAPPTRTDRPPMVYTIGVFGSGADQAAVATTSSSPLALRLLWRNVPVMRHRSDPGGAVGNQYALGTSVAYQVEGTPGSFYITGLDTVQLVAPLAVPGIVGLLWISPGYDRIGTLDASGLANHAVVIPPVPGLVGLRVIYQAGVLDAVSGVGQLTNGSDHFVNP